VRAFYESFWADAPDDPEPWAWERRRALLLTAVAPGERVLDLGCGSGELTAQIVARGARVTGVDSSAEMVARAHERFPDLDVRLADGEQLKVDGPFDAVFSNAALHWMTRPDEVLAGVRAVLRGGGRFAAEMGAARNVTALVSALREAARQIGLDAELPLPWYFPTPAEQATRLERAGFTVRLLQYVDRPTRLTDVTDGAADWWPSTPRRWTRCSPPSTRSRRLDCAARTASGWPTTCG
jgi:SAM-dependent methyltransferase